MNSFGEAGSGAELIVAVLVHDGETVLTRTLEYLAAQHCLNGVRIVVICNGCSDGSAAVARTATTFFNGSEACYEVLELPTGGRAEALNAVRQRYGGDLAIVDHDARLSPHALCAIRSAFQRGYRFATLLPTVEHSRSLFVRAYYRFWADLLYVQRSPATIGLYAISNCGLQCVPDFPAGYPDDKFARLHFHVFERVRIETESYCVTPQNDLISLVRDRARYNNSNRKVARLLMFSAIGDAPRRLRDEMAGLWNRPADAIVFALVFVLALAYAGLRRASQAFRSKRGRNGQRTSHSCRHYTGLQ